MRLRTIVLLVSVIASCSATAQTGAGWASGSVLDPSGLSVIGASLEVNSAQGAHLTAATSSDGTFSIHLLATGMYTVRVEAPGFAPMIRTMQLSAGTTNLILQLQKVTAVNQDVVVAAD